MQVPPPPASPAPGARRAPAWLLLLAGWLGVQATLSLCAERPADPVAPAAPDRPTTARAPLPPGLPTAAPAAPAAVDLARANVAELRALPGLGARRATDLVRRRWAQGGADFPPESVPGIGPRTAEAIRRATAWPPEDVP